MRVWTDRLLPRLTDRLLDDADVRRARERTCAELTGDVLELGFGSGLNVPHYPAGVTGVWAVDPSVVAHRLARRRIDAAAVPVHHAAFTAEMLPFPDGRFDVALSTFTLCTVPDVAGALREVLRVLAPGGRLHFLEHGLAPDAGVARWQRRLAPLNRAVAGGCHLDRDVGALLLGAGFDLEECTTYYGQGPRAFAYRYQGLARRTPRR